MSRPEPDIINEQTLPSGHVWQILKAEAYYVITYLGEPVGIRVIPPSLEQSTYKYKKMTYTNLGNALAQVRNLNYTFKCRDFDVMQVTV